MSDTQSECSRLVLSDAPCLLSQANIALILGRVEAVVIQQIHYWGTSSNELIGKIHQGRRWIYNSYKALTRDIKIYSESTIFRAVRNLEKKGILLSDTLHEFKGNRTKWYAIDHEALNSFLSSSKNDDDQKNPEENLTRWSRQNDDIFKGTEITSENTVLNNARAREPFSAKNDLEYNPPETEGILVEKAEEVVSSEPLKATQVVSTTDQPQQPSLSTLSDEDILTILEEINPLLPEPVKVVTPVLRNTLRKRMRSHFGQGETGRANLKDYLTKCANNAFLMGQKAMKNGTLFVAKMAFLLSPKTIEASWENAGVFNIYPPKKTPDSSQEGARESNPAGAETNTLPILSLDEVLETAISETDKRVKETLYQTLGAVKYRVWFYAGEFVARGLLGGEPDFSIKGGFTRDYVLTHYDAQLKQAFEGV